MLTKTTLAILLFCSTLFGQAWSSILDPSRAIDWSNVGIPGGIPVRNTICSTLTSSATSTTINAAIAACPSGEVVYLGAGTYTLSAGITFIGTSNVTLRGAGPTQTILKFTGYATCDIHADVCVRASSIGWEGGASQQPGGSMACSWTAGYAQGTTSITLNSCGGTPPLNQMLILDQANDTTDTGGVYICDTTATGCTWKGLGAGNSDGRTIGGVDYSSQQIVYVTSVSGSGSGPYTVGISPGLYMNNWRSGQNPGAWWVPQVSGDSIENMTLDHTAAGTGPAAGLDFFSCYECWAKNIRSIDANHDHVIIQQGARNVVRDSYFYIDQSYGTQSYGIYGAAVSDLLIENNIFDSVDTPLIFDAVQGVVVGYNFSTNNLNVTADFMQSSYLSHNAGSGMDLWEGNNLNATGCDDTWGASVEGTLFRNVFPGWLLSRTQGTIPLEWDAFCRGYNVVGNVLGKASYHTQYQSYPPSTGVSACQTTIYVIGWSGPGYCYTYSGMVDDLLVMSTMLRWGNYDVVNAAVEWNSSEIPTTGVPYINGNPVPATHSLANSWYLTSSPPWWTTPWGTPAWPSVGPDVTGGNIPNMGGYANNIPAELCYANSSVDTGYQTTYTVTAASWSSGTATLTIGANTLTASEVITVSGITPSGYNGTFEITGENSTQISYDLASNPGSYSSGGTFKFPNVLLFDASTCYSSTPTVGTPVASPGAGTYGSAQSVSLTATNSTSIYYSTTGTPSCAPSGTLYTGVITVSVSETLQAIGCAVGYSPSSVLSAGYTIGTALPPTSITAWPH